MAKKISTTKKSSGILTIRIDDQLDEILNEICGERRISKANLIRNYLELAKYVLIEHNSVKSLNENNLVMLKRNIFKSIIEELDEIKQIDLGAEIAQFINDIARLQDELDNIEYKLDLCSNLGLFPKFIDKANYILFSKEFGPKKFVEAFVWQLITKGDSGDFSKSFIESELERSSKIKGQYNKKINPIRRDASFFAFEFAKLED